MNAKTLIKNANSKGKLAAAVVMYQRTLSHYANEAKWAVKGDDITWGGDDDPTYAASVVLGKRKHDSNYKPSHKSVREPDNMDRVVEEQNATDKG